MHLCWLINQLIVAAPHASNFFMVALIFYLVFHFSVFDLLLLTLSFQIFTLYSYRLIRPPTSLLCCVLFCLHSLFLSLHVTQTPSVISCFPSHRCVSLAVCLSPPWFLISPADFLFWGSVTSLDWLAQNLTALWHHRRRRLLIGCRYERGVESMGGGLYAGWGGRRADGKRRDWVTLLSAYRPSLVLSVALILSSSPAHSLPGFSSSHGGNSNTQTSHSWLFSSRFFLATGDTRWA